MKKIDKAAIIWISVWGLINILQAVSSELINDEAYYWIFNLQPSWGYFNHPPAIGIMIHLSELLFNGEIAVRFCTVLMNLWGLWLIYRVVQPKDLKLFFLLIFGMVIFHVLSFISVPDVPSYFFTCVYFYYLKEYIEKEKLFSAIMIGLAVALMGYAKYQGILVVFFSMVPLLSLIKKPKTWIAFVVASLAFLPHLYWQFTNNFPTFRFHLMERMPEPWKLTFPLEYLGGQLAVFGPLISIPIFIALFRFKSKNNFEKSLIWTVWGSIIFFFIMSFKGRTEANWTSFLILPVTYVAYHYFENKSYWRPKIIALSSITLILVAVIRVYAVVDFLPEKINPKKEFHGHKEWALALEEKAQNLPVIFYSAYQPVGQYMFYTDQEAFLISMDRNSGSQFVLWSEWEQNLQHQRVFNYCNGWVNCPDSINILGRQQPYRMVDNWRSFNYIKIKAKDPFDQLNQGETRMIEVTVTNPTDEMVYFTGTQEERVLLHSAVYRHNVPISVHQSEFPLESLGAGETKTIKAWVKAPLEEGKFKYSFSIEVPNLHVGKNCQFYVLFVN